MIRVNNKFPHWFGLILCLGICVSCEKEELPVPAHDPGDVITNSVKMEPDYRYQLFFDLETNTMVKKNSKTLWDLGFESSYLKFNYLLPSQIKPFRFICYK